MSAHPLDSSDPPSPSVSVILMAYNEVENIRSVAADLKSVLDGLRVPYEVIVVDDGSTDGTSERAADLTAGWSSARLLRHSRNAGLGAVYRTGFANARGEFVTFFPADGQFPAQVLIEFLECARDADLVLGYLPNERRDPVPRLLSVIERTAYRVLFGRLPRFQGLLMYRRKLQDGMILESTGRGWTVLMEFIVRGIRAGAKTVSIPTSLHARLSGRSKVSNLRTIAANAYGLIRLRLII